MAEATCTTCGTLTKNMAGSRCLSCIVVEQKELRPQGLKRCAGCNEVLPLENFRGHHKGQPASRCRPCHNKHLRPARDRAKKRYKERYPEKIRAAKQRRKARVVAKNQAARVTALLAQIESGEQPAIRQCDTAPLDAALAEQNLGYCRDCYTIKSLPGFVDDSCGQCVQELAEAKATFQPVDPFAGITIKRQQAPATVLAQQPTKYSDTVPAADLKAENKALLPKGKKRCAWCGNICWLEDFYKHAARSDGRMNLCKDCNKQNVYRWRVANPDADKRISRIAARKAQLREPLTRRLVDGYYKARDLGLPHEKATQETLLKHWENHGINPWECFYCKQAIPNAKRLHIDHHIPLNKGGPHTLDNLVPACLYDNVAKNNKLPAEYAEHMKTAPPRPTTIQRLHNALQTGKSRAKQLDKNADTTITGRQLYRYMILNGIDPDSCYWCSEGDAEHLDHIQPLARNGHHTIDNLAPSCADCNHKKNDQTPEEFAQLLHEIGQLVKKPTKQQTDRKLINSVKASVLNQLKNNPAGLPRSDALQNTKHKAYADKAIAELLNDGLIREVEAPPPVGAANKRCGIYRYTTKSGDRYQVVLPGMPRRVVGTFSSFEEASAALDAAYKAHNITPPRMRLQYIDRPQQQTLFDL